MAQRALDASIAGEIQANVESQRQNLSGWVAAHTRVAEDAAAHMGALDDASGVPSVDEIQPSKDEMLLGLTVGREDGHVVSYPSGDLTGKLIPSERVVQGREGDGQDGLHGSVRRQNHEQALRFDCRAVL